MGPTSLTPPPPWFFCGILVGHVTVGANMETETVDREVWQRFRQGGETALSIAASNGKAEVVRVLLAAGAKVRPICRSE